MKSSKLALYIVLLPIAVIVIVSSLFLAFFDAKAYKQDLVEYVKESSGRTLVFEGDPELMLYPDFGMKLGAMQFSNAPGFGQTPMLSVNEVSISVDVKSVLQLEPKVSQLILSELQIDLQKNKQGKTNWDDLVPEKAQQQTSQEESDTKDDETSDFELAGAFEGINMNNAQISWLDESTGEQINIDDLDFTTGKITPTESFPLSLHVKLRKQKELIADVNFESQVFFDQKNKVLSLNQLNLKMNAQGDLIPFDKNDIELKSDVRFDLKNKELEVNDLSLKTLNNGGLMQQIVASVAGQLSMNLNTQQLNISDLSLRADITDESMPKGQLNSDIKSEKLSVSLNKRKVAFDNLQLGLNNLLFQGDILVKDYAKPAVSFNLNAKNVDIDELLGIDNQASETNTSDSAESSQDQDTEIALPTELLRSLALDGTLAIEKLKVMNVKSSNNVLKITANNGLINIKPLSLNLYEGSLANEMLIDVRKDKPKYAMKTALNTVQIGDLLIDFMQLDKLSGAANINIDVNTQGNFVSQLKQNLQGDIALRFADGSLKGFNLRHLTDVAKAKLSGSEKPKETLKETDFTELKLSGKIIDGVFSSNDLSLKSPLIRVGGEGLANINTNELDYTVNAKLIGSLEGQTGEGLEAKGVLVPVRLFGPFSGLKTDILLDNMLKQEAKNKVNAAKQALKAKKQAAADALKKQKLQKAKELQLKQDTEKLKMQQQLEEKQRQEKAELEAKKQAEKEKLKLKAEEKFKSLFN